MPDRRQYSLMTSSFNPTPVQFTDFVPAKASIDSFSRALSRMEERKRKADEKSSAMDVAFGAMRDKLHNDKETLQWFDNRVKQYKEDVESYAQLGDYGNALRSATLLAGQAAKDGEILDRIEANTEYQKGLDILKKKVSDGKISQETFNWYKDKHYQYDYNEIRDDDGNITGGYLATDTNNTPLDDISWESMVSLAYKLITTKKGSNTLKYQIENKTNSSVYSQVGTDSKGNPNYILTAPNTSEGRVSTNDIDSEIKFEDIVSNLREILRDPGRNAQLNQAFEVAKYSFEQLENKLKDYKSHNAEYYGLSEEEYETKVNNLQQQVDFQAQYMKDNGSIISFENYVANKINNSQYAKTLAHRHYKNLNVYDYGYGISGASSSSSNNKGEHTNKNDSYKTSVVELPKNEETNELISSIRKSIDKQCNRLATDGQDNNTKK